MLMRMLDASLDLVARTYQDLQLYVGTGVSNYPWTEDVQKCEFLWPEQKGTPWFILSGLFPTSHVDNK